MNEPSGFRAEPRAPGAPLAGLTVLSLAEQYPGPFATLLLSDLGARVVLIERPKTGDPSRANLGFFEALNRGKLSVTLDLKSEAGRDAFLMLVTRADALLEGFRPGVMARLRLGYDTVSRLNPALVYVSISGFGQDGPYRDRPGHDLSFQAVAGLLHDRLASGDTTLPWLSLGNLASGAFAAFGTVAALLGRQQSGRGSHVDLAMLDSLVALLSAHLVPLLNNSGPTRVPTDPGYGLFMTSGGRLLALSIYGEDIFWEKLCRTVGLDELSNLSLNERLSRELEVRERLAERFRTASLDEWAARLDAEGLPYAPVNDLPQVISNPQVIARGLVVTVNSGGVDRRFIRQPLLFAGVQAAPRIGAPTLGEHTEDLLKEAGCSDDLLARVLATNRKDAEL